jgi:hypothetical protein
MAASSRPSVSRSRNRNRSTSVCIKSICNRDSSSRSEISSTKLTSSRRLKRGNRSNSSYGIYMCSVSSIGKLNSNRNRKLSSIGKLNSNRKLSSSSNPRISLAQTHCRR